MKIKKILQWVLILAVLQGYSQNSYWVFFRDKSGVEFNPAEYFDAKALERRLRHQISLFDESDYPLNQDYVHEVQNLSDSTGFHSRWLNAMLVYADEYQIEAVKTLPCVKSVVQKQASQCIFADYKQLDGREEEAFLREKQINSMEGALFEPINVDGKGVRIAVFDGGFPNVDKEDAFAHIFKNGNLKGTYDFTKNKEYVFYSNGHGTMVLSNIAGIWNGQKVGLATGAEFLLAKTEVLTEPFAEEEYWLAAAEWADKNGADIISSSLGYTHHRYFIEDMDGTSLVAKAANMAFRKGILVVNAAGNEGSSEDWKYIGTPADADSVLSIGGINPFSDYHIDFSSYGPTADGRMKPNVSAMGQTFVITSKGASTAYGTSFATPLVSGFCACVLQVHPDYTVQDLFREVQKSGDLYPYYDYAHGYGVPKASYFTQKDKTTDATFRIEQNKQGIDVEILSHFSKKDFANPYLYYHIAKPNGFIKKYALVKVIQKHPLSIDSDLYESGDIVRIHYQGYTKSIKI